MNDELLAKFDEIEQNGGSTADGERFYDVLEESPPSKDDLTLLVERYRNSSTPAMQGTLAFVIYELQEEDPDPSISNLLYPLIEGLRPHWADAGRVRNSLNALTTQAQQEIPWTPLDKRPECVFPFLIACLTSDDENLVDNAKRAFWLLHFLAPDDQGLVEFFSQDEREQIRDILISTESDDKPLIEALGL